MLGAWTLAVPLILGGGGQDELPPDWKACQSKEGRFAVSMPSAPTTKKLAVKTANGDLPVMMMMADGPKDSSFAVSYSDYGPDEVKGDADKRLEQAVKGAVESVRGKLRGDAKPIKLDDKYPGREICIEQKGAIVAKMRIYLVDNRLYQVIVLGNGPFFATGDKDVAMFLDSFRLSK